MPTVPVLSAGVNLPFDQVYKVPNDSANWYQTLPYGFRFVSQADLGKQIPNIPSGATRVYSWLPISPSNLTITTHFATNLVTTLYGIVEEHSEVRYYDIIIQGTTGFSPRYVAPIADDSLISSAYPGRKSGIVGGLSLGGFFQQTVSTVATISDQLNGLQDVFGVSKDRSGIPSTADEFKECSGSVTGYLAFHNFYRLLQIYKKDTAGQISPSASRALHPLQFINNKDGNQYDVVPVTFTMTRSAESPLLYNYNIMMRGFNLRSADEVSYDLVDMKTALGIGGSTSWMAKASQAAAHATAALSGITKLGGGLGG